MAEGKSASCLVQKPISGMQERIITVIVFTYLLFQLYLGKENVVKFINNINVYESKL